MDDLLFPTMVSREISDYMDEIQEDLDTRDFDEDKADTWVKKLKRLLNRHQGYEGTTETMTTRNLIKCISLYIQYLFTIAFLKKDNEEQILISRRYLDPVKEMLQSNLNRALLRGSLSNILTVTIAENPQNWCIRKEVLKLILDFVKQSNQREIQLIMESLPDYMIYKLFDNVGVYGDYDLQSVILELMMRIYGQERINAQMQSLVPESQGASQGLGSITLRTFDKDVRNFLNILHKQHRYTCVFSIICKDIQLEGKTLGTNIWLDFNMSSCTISWYYNKSHCERDTFQHNINRYLVTVFRSNIHSIDIKKSDADYTFVITLNKPCLCDCENLRLILQTSRKITITFESTEESNILVLELLPKFMKVESNESYFGDAFPDGVLAHISCQKRSGLSCFNPFDEHASIPSLSQSSRSTMVDVDSTIQPKKCLYEELVSAEVDIGQIQSLTQNNDWANNQDRDTRIAKCSTNFHSTPETHSNEENTEYETAKSRFSVNDRSIIQITNSEQEFTEIDFQPNPSEELETDPLDCFEDNSRNELKLNPDLSRPENLTEISIRRDTAELSTTEFRQNKETDETTTIDLSHYNQTSDLASYLAAHLANEKEEETVRVDKHGDNIIFMRTTQELLYDLEDPVHREGTGVAREVPLDVFERKNETRDDTIKIKQKRAQECDGISKRDDKSKTPRETKKAPSRTKKEKSKESTDFKKKHGRIKNDKKWSRSRSPSNADKKGTHKVDTVKSFSMNKDEGRRENRDGSRKEKKANDKHDRNAFDEPERIKEKGMSVKKHNENINLLNTDVCKVQKPIQAKEENILESLTHIKEKETVPVEKHGDENLIIRTTQDVLSDLEGPFHGEGTGVAREVPLETFQRKNETRDDTIKVKEKHAKGYDGISKKDDKSKTPRETKKTPSRTKEEQSKKSIDSKKKQERFKNDKERSRSRSPSNADKKGTHKEDTMKTFSMNVEEDSRENRDGSRRVKKVNEKHDRNAFDEPAKIKEKGIDAKKHNENINIFNAADDKLQMPIQAKEKNILQSLKLVKSGKDSTKEEISKESKSKKDFFEDDKESKASTPREKNNDDSDNKDGPCKANKMNKKRDRSALNEPAGVVKEKEKNVKERPIQSKEKMISKPLSLINTVKEKAKEDITKESKKKKYFLEDDKENSNTSLALKTKENSNTSLALKTKEKKILGETLLTSFIETKEDGAENKGRSTKLKKINEDRKALIADTTKEKCGKECDKSVNVFIKDDISTVPILSTTNETILQSPSLIKTKSGISRECKRGNGYIEDDSQLALMASTSKHNNTLEETVKNLKSPSLIKRKQYKADVGEISRTQSKQILRSPSVLSITEEKLALEISWTYERTTEYIEKDSNEVRKSINESDRSIESIRTLYSPSLIKTKRGDTIHCERREISKEDIVETSKKKVEKRDVNENGVEISKQQTKRSPNSKRDKNGNIVRQSNAVSIQASPMVKRKMKSKTNKGVNLFLRIKQNILKEKRKKRKQKKLANFFGSWRKAMASRKNKKVISKSPENMVAQPDTNQNRTDSEDNYERTEITTRAETLFDELFGSKSSPITNEQKKFQTNPELVASRRNLSTPAETNIGIRCNGKVENADSSGEWMEDLLPVKRDMAIRQVKTNEFDQNDKENIIYKDISGIQILHSESEEFSRSNQIDDHDVREESMNIFTEAQVHEVPNRVREITTHFEEESMVNKVAIEEIQNEVTRIPSEKSVNVEITELKSDACKIENNIPERRRSKRKLYNPSDCNDITFNTTPLPQQSHSKTKKTVRRSKIMKSRKKTKTKTKSAVVQDKTQSLNNCGELERSPAAANSDVSVYQRLISTLGGSTSITEYIQKRRETSANRDISTRAPFKRKSTNVEISSNAQAGQHSSFKRKTEETHSKHSKKICVLSNVTLVPGKTTEYLDGEDQQQEGREVTHSLVEAQANVQHWVATAVSCEKFIKIRSQDYIGKGLLLVYYPTVFSPTANVINDVKSLAAKSDKISEGNTEILIVTMDSPYSILAWIQLNNLQSLKLPIISDMNRVISKANNFCTHLRAFSFINPGGEQVYLTGYLVNFAMNINKLMAEIRQF